MTPNELRLATGCKETVALAFATPITVAVKRYNITHVAEFLAQMAHESGLFTRLQENLNYTTTERLMDVFPRYIPTKGLAMQFVNRPEKLANYVYDDVRRVNKLGNTQAGDGWKFRGRGLKHLTGRWNYEKYQAASQLPVVTDPDLLLDPMVAADSAGWFWQTNGCDALSCDVIALTKRINGGQIGLHARMLLTNQARAVLS